jgi:hypothetical protein
VFRGNGGETALVGGEATKSHLGVSGAGGVLLEKVWGLEISGRVGDHGVEGCGLVGEDQEPERRGCRRIASERTRRLL